MGNSGRFALIVCTKLLTWKTHGWAASHGGPLAVAIQDTDTATDAERAHDTDTDTERAQNRARRRPFPSQWRDTKNTQQETKKKPKHVQNIKTTPKTHTSKTPEGRRATFRVQRLVFFFFFIFSLF